MTDHADTIRRDAPIWHVRKEDVHKGSARDVDPPFASFDVVLRRDYEALEAERQQAQETIKMHDAQAATFLARAEQAEAERQQAQEALQHRDAQIQELCDELREAIDQRRQAIDALREIATNKGDPSWQWSRTFASAVLVKLGEKP